jgi:prophage regulatory protein
MEVSFVYEITEGLGKCEMEAVNNVVTQQILFINDIETIIGKDRLTLRRWWQVGKFPVPVKLHGTTLAWHRDVIDEWINHNMKASRR